MVDDVTVKILCDGFERHERMLHELRMKIGEIESEMRLSRSIIAEFRNDLKDLTLDVQSIDFEVQGLNGGYLEK